MTKFGAKRRKGDNWMDFKYARKQEVGIMISCPEDEFKELQVMRWAITHRPQDLPRRKHILAEGKTLEEVTIFIDRRSYRSLRKT